MSAWDIPADIRKSIEHRLKSDLAAAPADDLVPCFALWGERLDLFTFSVADVNRANVKYTFMFHVAYFQDENYLDIVECGFSK